MASKFKKPQKRILYNIDELPKYLYQYISLSGDKKRKRAKDFIHSSKFYFSNPKNFNDPYDCKIPPVLNASKETKRKFWKNHIKKQFPSLDAKAVKLKISHFLKYEKNPENHTEIIENFFRSLYNMGILCLTQNPDDMLMWSYYADGHRGICYRFKLELDNIKLMSKSTMLFLKVDYQNDFPKPNLYLDTDDDWVRDIFGIKANCWKNEREWRFINNSHTGLAPCPILKLDRIIFGIKTDEDIKDKIRTWVQNINESIELFLVTNKGRSFKLDIIPEQK